MDNLLKDDLVFACLPSDSKEKIVYLTNNSTAFHSWFLYNINKIRRKFKGLSAYEEIDDVVGELICAFTLLKSDVVSGLIYEPSVEQSRAPDFKVNLLNDQEFYCEVRRIRRNPTEVSRDDFIRIFSSQIKRIQLNFGVNLYCNNLKIQDFNEKQIYDKLTNEIDEIVDYIEEELNLIRDSCEDIKINLDIFAVGLNISVHHVAPSSRINRIKYYGDLYNCPVTQKEFMKFRDIIFEKLPQLVDESPNLLFIIADNDSHWYEDFEDSFSSILELVNNKDDRFFTGKGYRDTNEFINQFKKLGGIFILSRSLRGRLWINHDSYKTLNQVIIDYLNEKR